MAALVWVAAAAPTAVSRAAEDSSVVGYPVFNKASVLNTQAPGRSGVYWNANVATDGKGAWIAVWHSSNTLDKRIGRDWDILFALSSDNGETWTDAEPLNTNAESDEGSDRSPVALSDGRGGWLVFWTSADSLNGSIGLDRDILFSRSSDGGKTWASPLPLNINASSDWGDDADARAATDGKGHWVVVWNSNDTLGNTIGGDRDIMVASSSNNGVTWSTTQALNSNAATDAGFDISPYIATDAHGYWLVVWSSGESMNNQVGMDRDIFIARSSDNGHTWTAPQALNTNAAEDTRSDTSPAVATNGKGAWIATWSSNDTLDGTIGMDRDILVARSTDRGDSWSDPEPLHPSAFTDAREDSSPTVVADDSGNWVAVWHSWDSFNEHLGVDADILLAHSRDDGVSWSLPVALNPGASSDAGDDVLPQIATDGAGHWVAVWQSFDPVGNAIAGFEWDIKVSAGVVARQIPKTD
ncbi:MAG: sialidase family protein [Deltaproteobacteria bacterium]